MTGVALLEVQDLAVSRRDRADDDGRQIIDGASFSVARGRKVGLVGESGSGKSLCALGIVGLLPTGLVVTRGRILLDGHDLVGSTATEWRSVRGARIGLVFQDPEQALNPVRSIGTQIIDALSAHGDRPSRTVARRFATDLLGDLGFPSPATSVDDYPHEVSGGMRQRAMIAIAIAPSPDLVIADEPTTALDTAVQVQVLAALERVTSSRDAALLLISHDLGVVASTTDDVVVMYAGRTVERGPNARLLVAPAHGYTRGLLSSRLGVDRPGAMPAPIPGRSPSVAERIVDGCAFAPRCAFVGQRCAQLPPAVKVEAGWTSWCWEHDAVQVGRSDPATTSRSLAQPSDRPVVEASAVVAGYRLRRRFRPVLTGIDLVLHEGETVGLVGSSGSGKSTLARVMVGLHRTRSGHVLHEGKPVLHNDRKAISALRRDVQLVFQETTASLDPRWTVGRTVEEGLSCSGTRSLNQVVTINNLLTMVGLPPAIAGRYPRELSAGERQRVCIARALAPRPRLLLCDEPVSSLDASIRAQVLRLLVDLQHEMGLAYLFISHDLAAVAQVAHRIAVLDGGTIVETGPTAIVLREPRHERTRELVEASRLLSGYRAS